MTSVMCLPPSAKLERIEPVYYIDEVRGHPTRFFKHFNSSQMIPATKTIAAIEAAVVANQEEPFRRHLGASVIGDECARKLWYMFHWVGAEAFDGRMLRLFNRGHREEPSLIAYVKAAGIQIWEAGEYGDLKEQMRFSDCDGHFGGTPDGIGKGLPDLPPDEPFLCEFKTHNQKSFDKLVSDGIMRTKWKHFVQMQVCMYKLDLAYAVYFAINKNDDSLFVEIVTHDGREGPRAIQRAGTIIWLSSPPKRLNESPAHFACKYCHFNRLCHRGDVQPARNCRTCEWGMPFMGGVWKCCAKDVILDEAAQRAGCGQYKVNLVLQGRQP